MNKKKIEIGSAKRASLVSGKYFVVVPPLKGTPIKYLYTSWFLKKIFIREIKFLPKLYFSNQKLKNYDTMYQMLFNVHCN